MHASPHFPSARSFSLSLPLSKPKPHSIRDSRHDSKQETLRDGLNNVRDWKARERESRKSQFDSGCRSHSPFLLFLNPDLDLLLFFLSQVLNLMRFFSHGDGGAQEPPASSSSSSSAAAATATAGSAPPLLPAASRNASFLSRTPTKASTPARVPPPSPSFAASAAAADTASQVPIAAKRRLDLGGGAGEGSTPTRVAAGNSSSPFAAAAAAAAALPHYLPPRSHPLPALLPQFSWGGAGLTSALWAPTQAAPAPEERGAVAAGAAEQQKKVISVVASSSSQPPSLSSSLSSSSSSGAAAKQRGLLWRALNSSSSEEIATEAAAAATTKAAAMKGEEANPAVAKVEEGGPKKPKAPCEHEIAGSDVPLSAVPFDWRPDRDDVAWCYEEVDGDENVGTVGYQDERTLLVSAPAPAAPASACSSAAAPPSSCLISPSLFLRQQHGSLATIAEAAAAGELGVTLDDVRDAAARARATAQVTVTTTASKAPLPPHPPRPPSSAGGGSDWTAATGMSVGAERTQWWSGADGGGGGSFRDALRPSADGTGMLRRRTEAEKAARKKARGGGGRLGGGLTSWLFRS